MAKAKTVGVKFNLEIDEDGWPPIGSEILQGIEINPYKIKIDNTPFFITNVALHDVVKVSNVGNQFIFEEIEGFSGNHAISVILRSSSMKTKLLNEMRALNCYCEYGEFGSTKMLAISIPYDVSYAKIRDIMDDYEKKDLISYAELCLAG